MTCRKTLHDVETGVKTLFREAGGEGPVYSSTGVRHEGGVISMEALGWNGGPCRLDAKRDAQVGSPLQAPEDRCGAQGRSRS